jgi:hypothetical protein
MPLQSRELFSNKSSSLFLEAYHVVFLLYHRIFHRILRRAGHMIV